MAAAGVLRVAAERGMSHAFEFEVTAPFAVGNPVADVDLEDGSTAQIVLRHGRFSGALDSRPVHARLTEAPPPSAEAPLAVNHYPERRFPALASQNNCHFADASRLVAAPFYAALAEGATVVEATRRTR